MSQLVQWWERETFWRWWDVEPTRNGQRFFNICGSALCFILAIVVGLVAVLVG